MFKVIIPISGGKDSQACLKLALREYQPKEILGLFCDTRFEHPLTYQHIENMQKLYNVEITTICAGSVPEQVKINKRFPSGLARFCTDRLKIRPSIKFFKAMAERYGGFEVWYGMRSEESAARAARYEDKLSSELYLPHEVLKQIPKYLAALGVRYRLPIIDLSEEDVFEILSGEENPLYSKGFGRVGCFPCMAGGDKWKEKAFFYDETGRKHYQLMKELEPLVGRSIFNSKGGKKRDAERDFEGCSICAI